MRGPPEEDAHVLPAATPRSGKAMFHKTTHSLLQNKSPLNKCHTHNQATGIIIIVISFSTGRPYVEMVIDRQLKPSAQNAGPRNVHAHAPQDWNTLQNKEVVCSHIKARGS